MVLILEDIFLPHGVLLRPGAPSRRHLRVREHPRRQFMSPIPQRPPPPKRTGRGLRGMRDKGPRSAHTPPGQEITIPLSVPGHRAFEVGVAFSYRHFGDKSLQRTGPPERGPRSLRVLPSPRGAGPTCRSCPQPMAPPTTGQVPARVRPWPEPRSARARVRVFTKPKSGRYKKPRLKKNAVPSYFPWTEEIQITDQKEDLFDESVSNIETDNIKEQNEFLLSFNNVLDILDKKELHLPNQWAYIKHVNDNIKLLIFFLPKYNLINGHENKYTFNAVKEVVLKENMMLEVTVLKQPLIHILPDMQIHNTIENIEQLKESLFSVDNFNICLGAINIANDIEYLGYSLAFKDICNTWRHNKCLLLIPQSLKTCKFCLNIKSSLNKKKSRMKTVKVVKRIRLSKRSESLIITENQKKLLLLRKRYYKAEKIKKRSKYVVEKLKTELMNCMTQIKEISRQTIEDELKKEGIPKNQLTAIHEIIQAAKHRNPKGRRYHEEWILLCMLMHMKSPSAYDFLRNNQILPVPCIRTIRRCIYVTDICILYII
ncbi:hypothetical protein ALC62_01978 [Cyphomyrmex costatus]|uniref:THAP-type domain-containing protein n=1 Tax=Cyphomyrmex costatus TaxID=456900 RepID=A0A151INL8_9HYME|nr:hypothetical protein ALC62_01978 [Cyphomyrmex costatus]